MIRWNLIPLVVLVAGCATRRPMPPLAGPSSEPVRETPARVALLTAPGDAEWKALGDEATGLLSQYLRINTTNPPGNEIAAAHWLADVLRRDGIEARIFEPAPGKANLYARLSGDGSPRPLILLNEGGVTRGDVRGGVEFYGVGTTEKSPFWLDVTARGTAGHGSRPTPDNPVHRLIRALNRIADWRTPLTVTPTVERSFRDLATIERDSTARRWLSDIRTGLRDSVAARAITARLTYNALLRNTISITGLKGSAQTNVLPPVATAAIDARLLPGQDPAAFLAEL